MGAAVSTAADIASAAAIPTSATRRRRSSAAAHVTGEEGWCEGGHISGAL